MRPVSGFLAVAWGVASITRGAPLQPGHVAADAAWVVHLDVESLARSPLGDRLRQRLATPPLNRPIESMALAWGFDPRMDLDGLTAYGSKMDGSDAVCLLYGRFAPLSDGFAGAIPLIPPGVVARLPAGAGAYGQLIEPNLLVAGRTPRRIRDARAVIEGRTAAPTVPTPPTGSGDWAFFSAWMTNATPETLPARAVVFQRAARIDLEFSVTGHWLDGRMVLAAGDAEAAEEMRQVLAGMAGALLLKAKPGSDRETLLRRVRISRTGVDVVLESRIPVELAERYLAAVIVGEAAAKISRSP